MPFDASERAFKIFTEAYGKAWSPQAAGLAAIVPVTETVSEPLRVEPPVNSRIRPKRRLPTSP